MVQGECNRILQKFVWNMKKRKKEKGLSRDVRRRVAKVGDGRSDVTG